MRKVSINTTIRIGVEFDDMHPGRWAIVMRSKTGRRAEDYVTFPLENATKEQCLFALPAVVRAVKFVVGL